MLQWSEKENAMRQGKIPWLLLAGAALALSPARPAPAQGYFKDVPPHHWAYNAVNELAALGILRGYPPEPQPARPVASPSATPSRPSRHPASLRRGRPVPTGPHRRSPG
jgi:S-layer family protein